MALFKETINQSEAANKVIKKFAVPLIGYVSKYASFPYTSSSNKKELITGFTYFSTMVALEKFTTFLD